MSGDRPVEPTRSGAGRGPAGTAVRPWLHVIGIGEDGMDGLSPTARAALEAAEVIVGAERHHGLSAALTAERLTWPSPFDALLDRLAALRGRRVAVLVTGDPLWFSAGARIARAFARGETVFHPHVGAFQLAAARLGWSLADVETLTAHGRPVEQVIPFITPGARLLVLSTGAQTPARLARILVERGYGDSPMVAFAHMGGDREARFDGTAGAWAHEDLPDFNTVAIDCVAGPQAVVHARTPGLPDAAFVHDGNITKSELRAITLARLMPMRGALLWDIGAGCGSVGVEWMRAARDARAIGIEPRDDRRALAAANAAALGAPRLKLVAGAAPDALSGLEPPDAVFIGGGLSRAAFAAALAALRPFGRLVANAVTLDSQALLAELAAEHGADLVRLSVERAEPLGARAAFRPLMPVVQLAMVKR